MRIADGTPVPVKKIPFGARTVDLEEPVKQAPIKQAPPAAATIPQIAPTDILTVVRLGMVVRVSVIATYCNNVHPRAISHRGSALGYVCQKNPVGPGYVYKLPEAQAIIASYYNV